MEDCEKCKNDEWHFDVIVPPEDMINEDGSVKSKMVIVETENSAEWFSNNFFDTRKHRPKREHVIAIYRATAFFVDGWLKRNVISILKNNAGAETARRVMENLVCAIEEDCVKIPLEMAKDLASGMTEDEVAKKEYKMIVRYSYWTEKKNVPEDDPHWFTIDIINQKEMESIFEKDTGHKEE